MAESGTSRPMLAHGVAATTPTRIPMLARELRRLRAVFAVAQRGSVSGAANALHLSQSAITRAVRDVERELGFPLFERSSRGMVQTPPGVILAGRLKRAWTELEVACERALAATPPGVRGRSGGSRFASVVSGRGLESLIAIAAMGSETRVASHLGVTQPAVHMQLQEVEQLTGARLFNRTPLGTRLTESGEALLRGAKLALAEIRIAEEELGTFGGQVRGTVAIGALPLSSGVLVPMAADRIANQHPDIQLAIVDGTYDALLQLLRTGDIDLIVGALRPSGERADIVQEALFEDTLRVIGRHGHPSLQNRPRLLADLVDQPWIVPLRGTPARRAAEEAFQSEGLTLPALAIQANSPAIVSALILGGDRLALLSPHQVRNEIAREQLAVFDVPVPQTPRRIGIATRRAGKPSPGAVAVVEQLRMQARSL